MPEGARPHHACGRTESGVGTRSPVNASIRLPEDWRGAVSRLRLPVAVTWAVVLTAVLAACGGVPQPSVSTDPEGWLRCESDQWSVDYPPDWVVQAADAARDIADCALFAREASQTEPEDDWGWSGAQVVLGLEEGCRGSFEVSMAEEELELEGFPAWRRTLRDGHGDGGPATAYEYVINLSPGAECETGRWFYGRTEADDPGDFGENQATLDRMIETLTLSDDD